MLETISPRHLIIFIRQRWAVFLLIELYSWDAIKVASFVNWITKSSHFFWLFFVLAKIVPVIAVNVLLQFLHLNLCLSCLIPSLLNLVLLQKRTSFYVQKRVIVLLWWFFFYRKSPSVGIREIVREGLLLHKSFWPSLESQLCSMKIIVFIGKT